DVVLERAELGLDVLDRDRALEPGGAPRHGLVDGGHATLAAHLDELVLAVDQGAFGHLRSIARVGPARQVHYGSSSAARAASSCAIAASHRPVSSSSLSCADW